MLPTNIEIYYIFQISAQITLLTLGMCFAEIMWQHHVQDVSAILEGTMEGNTGAMVFAIGKTVNAREMVTKLNLNQLYKHAIADTTLKFQ